MPTLARARRRRARRYRAEHRRPQDRAAHIRYEHRRARRESEEREEVYTPAPVDVVDLEDNYWLIIVHYRYPLRNRVRDVIDSAISRIKSLVARLVRRITRSLRLSTHVSKPHLEPAYSVARLVAESLRQWVILRVDKAVAMVTLPAHGRCVHHAGLIRWDGYRGPGWFYGVYQVYRSYDRPAIRPTGDTSLIDRDFLDTWIEKMEEDFTEILGPTKTDYLDMVNTRIAIAYSRKKDKYITVPVMHVAYTPLGMVLRYTLLGVSDIDTYYHCSLYYAPGVRPPLKGVVY